MVFFIGSYTEYIIPGFGGEGEGIYTVELNSSTGELKILHKKKTVNPSYLAISQDNRFLYSVNETLDKGRAKIQAFRINEDFSLDFLNEQSINGSLSCHVSSYENSLIISNYGTGNVFYYNVDTSGRVLDTKNYFQHVGHSVNMDRQEGPHAHQSAVHPNGKNVFVCDLGLDIVKSYMLKENKLVANEEYDIVIPPGNGPRHLVFNKSGDLGYLINELSGKVSILEEKDGRFQYLRSYDTYPLDDEKIPSASAIRIHPNGKFLFAANRTSDTITVFEIIENRLKILNYYSTDGVTLREINISNDGRFLIACHQDSNDTVVFKILDDGSLIKKFEKKDIIAPVCVTFFNSKKE